jgi:hypothetical protein
MRRHELLVAHEFLQFIRNKAAPHQATDQACPEALSNLDPGMAVKVDQPVTDIALENGSEAQWHKVSRVGTPGHRRDRAARWTDFTRHQSTLCLIPGLSDLGCE